MQFASSITASMRTGSLRIAIDGLRIDVKQGGDFQHHRFAAGGSG
jgi:hypothetical protein